mgnify:CR=1 FL=1
MGIKFRLIVMNFLQYAIWGSWLISLGAYLGGGLDFTGLQIGSFFATMGVASLFMPAVMGIIADRWIPAQKLLGTTCGVFGEPAGVTGAAALKKACEEGLIPHDATVVSVVTGNGLKDVANAIKSAGEPIHIEPDLDLMVEEFKKRGVTVE